MSALNKLIIIPFIFAWPLAGQAQDAIGWHWYNEAKVERKAKIDDKHKQPSASMQMLALRRMVREAKDQAILYPTEANLRTYVILQNFVIQQAARFTQIWQKMLLKNPELDYSIKHPTQSGAQQLLHEQDYQQETLAIKALGQQYGILFFYRGKHELDQALAPTILSFCQTNQITLLPITVDGQQLPLFANSSHNQQQASILGIKHFPALILVDLKTKQTIPLHYGFISESGLRQRCLQIITNFNEEK